MMQHILDRSWAEEKVTSAVKHALAYGADEAAAELSLSSSSLSRFAASRIIDNVQRNSISLRLAVSVGKRECLLQSDVTNGSSIETLCRRCVENAQMFDVNDEHLPPVTHNTVQSINAFDPEVADLDPRDKAHIIADITCNSSKQGMTAFGAFKDSVMVTAVANSSGVLAYYPETEVGFSLTARTPDGTGSGREERAETWLSALDPYAISNIAMDRAANRRAPREMPPGDYTVILTPRAAAAYLAMMLWSMDAKMVETGRSPFSRFWANNQLIDSPVFSENVTLYSDLSDTAIPVRPFGPAFSFEGSAGQSPVVTAFSMGLPVRDSVLIDKGVMRRLMNSYSWAIKKGIQPEGYPNVLKFAGTDMSLDEMVGSTDRGILVTSLWYIRWVDPNDLLLTGLTRDGTFYIENGKIQFPIKNFRFNESPLVSLKNIECIGQVEKIKQWGFTLAMPVMKCNNFTFSSISDAI